MPNRLKFALGMAAIAVPLAGALMIQRQTIEEQKRDISRLETNVESLHSGAEWTRVRDSLRCLTLNTLVLEVDELEKLRAKDAALIRDLKLRAKDVRTIIKTETEIRDTVAYVLRDSCLSYSDKWMDFRACTADHSLAYSVRDSVSTLLFVEYRKRFLWWRWKPKYRISVVSHNPHSTVQSTEAVVVNEE